MISYVTESNGYHLTCSPKIEMLMLSFGLENGLLLPNFTPSDNFLCLDSSDDPKPKTSALILLTHEICSGFKPLPSEPLIQHYVCAASICFQPPSLTEKTGLG